MRKTSSGRRTNVLALQREHDDNGEQQRDQRERAHARNEAAVRTTQALWLGPAAARVRNAREKRNAEIDEDTLRNLCDGNVDDRAVQPELSRQNGDKDPRVERIEEDLKERIKRHQSGGVFGIAFRQFVPHNDHGDAARQTQS